MSGMDFMPRMNHLYPAIQTLLTVGNRESQYKKRINTIWKLQKNVPTNTMKTILDIVDIRRDIQGKATDVTWHGRPLDESQMERARKRYGFGTGRFLLAGDFIGTRRPSNRSNII
jgi:hypothetical protein